jgi:2-phospho-L-lactate guanylyltransferase
MSIPATQVCRWSLVVPVKVLARAKTRLAAAAGPYRERLALALAGDTVAAAIRSARVRQVVVVTDDGLAASELAALGADVVADEPDAGLNPALVHGAARRAGSGDGVGALSADLPALRPAELTRALDSAAAVARGFVADADGTGTTLYTARPGAAFTPAFGPHSRARHRAQGARELPAAGISGLRRDVDTLEDLRAALALGVGPRTAAVAAALGISATPTAEPDPGAPVGDGRTGDRRGR